MSFEGMKNTAKSILDAARCRFSRATACAWTRRRLSAYCSWDLPSRDLNTAEAHLKRCASCSHEYQRTGAIIHALLGLEMRRRGLHSPEEHAQALLIAMAASGAAPNSRQVTRPQRRLRLPAAGLAGACALLLICVSVFAYIELTTDTALHGVESGEQQRTLHLIDPASPEPKAPLEHNALPQEAASFCPGLTSSGPETASFLDVQIARQQASAASETMRPHSEADYEAWARQEYPHIMWLYDVLQGRKPAGPVDSPAGRRVSFRATEDGSPTITLSDREGNRLVLCATVADDGTLWFRSSVTRPGVPGAPVAYRIARAAIPWDGTPYFIPDWAQRLYASTAESERPKGWRALLIYSRQIFEFHRPRNLSEPNVNPLAQALLDAFPIAGLRAEPDWGLEAKPWQSQDRGEALSYAANVPSAKSALVFFCVSSEMVGVPAWEMEACHARSALARLLTNQFSASCGVSAFEKDLNSLLAQRVRLQFLTLGTM